MGMRILLMSRDFGERNREIFADSFRSLQSRGTAVEVRAIHYLEIALNDGWTTVWDRMVEENRLFRPSIIIFQYFHGKVLDDPRPCIGKCRRDNPEVLVLGSLGDPYGRGILWHRTPERELVSLASASDAFFTTNMGWVSEYLLDRGGRNIVCLPNAFSDRLFKKPSIDERKQDFDVSISANAPLARNPLKWLSSITRRGPRKRMIDLLYKRFGQKLAVYGSGWSGHPASKGWMPFEDQLLAYARSRIVVDAPPPIKAPYYTSDRAFFMLGSGSSVVLFRVPRLEAMFKDGEHCDFVTKISEIPDVCERILRLSPEELNRRRQMTLSLLSERHTPEKRADTILSVAEALLDVRKGKISMDQAKSQLRLWHFLPRTNLNEELNYAIAGWGR